jgi:hypothetical protein
MNKAELAQKYAALLDILENLKDMQQPVEFFDNHYFDVIVRNDKDSDVYEFKLTEQSFQTTWVSLEQQLKNRAEELFEKLKNA